MSTLVEVAAQVVSAHASNSAMTTDELVAEIGRVYAALRNLESANLSDDPAERRTALTVKEAFRKHEIVCLECGKGGFKTLSRHLQTTHKMKPKEYRKKHGIDSKQSLAAKSFSDARRQMAAEKGLADNLAKAREIRAAKLKARKAPLQPKQKVVKARVDQTATSLLATGTE
ncbi:MucR family transcriptional regulator [Geomonas sp. RF6]|uniref:MucR family transcriptional regulator n=1 Tax=Geomonas sp. RF6 TaxID=2897342 RepID=UPI001E443CBD|nr:MucR family transcriptional regulator [Geomonas sp. RF6]UFS70147.1 MucR family transcriptional regulator [Geomonas sp. RF6]